MSKLHLQLVSLALLLGLSSFCATKGASHQGQVGTSQPAALLANEGLNSTTPFADGGDPAPLPMPLPRLAFGLVPDGGDPAPLPMPLPRLAFGLVPDGGDPAPLPMPLPRLAFGLVPDGGDPAPLPMPLPGPRLKPHVA
jgi:hypothetical protein